MISSCVVSPLATIASVIGRMRQSNGTDNPARREQTDAEKEPIRAQGPVLTRLANTAAPSHPRLRRRVGALPLEIEEFPD
jgi:hypothetical protein